MINHKYHPNAPFRSRTVAEDRNPSHHPQESTGRIRYVLAQVAVVAGLVHGIVENDPYFVAGSFVMNSVVGVWFLCKTLRRERAVK